MSFSHTCLCLLYFIKAEEIVTYVKQALMDSIDKNTIMDAATKATAKTKVHINVYISINKFNTSEICPIKCVLRFFIK